MVTLVLVLYILPLLVYVRNNLCSGTEGPSVELQNVTSENLVSSLRTLQLFTQAHLSQNLQIHRVRRDSERGGARRKGGHRGHTCKRYSITSAGGSYIRTSIKHCGLCVCAC